jgi:hypothetical protein
VRRAALLVFVIACGGRAASSDSQGNNGGGLAASDAGSDANDGGGGGLPLGALCSVGSECASGVCFNPFGGTSGDRRWCTLRCNPGQDPVCNVPPFDGTCNTQGYCRLPP